MIGAEIIADVFVENGIERLYLFPGGTIAPTLNAAIARGIGFFCARHEQGAGYAALAHARLTGIPQVVMVTSGPGVTNVATCVADAYFDSTPVVFVTGQVGRADMRNGRSVRQTGFQELDTLALMKPIAKAVILADSSEGLRATFQKAFYIAGEGRPGPVVVDLPMDVQRGEVKEELVPYRAEEKNGRSEVSAQLEILAQWITQAEKPILLVGQGVILGRATDELRQLAHAHRIPVVMSLLGLSAFRSDDELCMGFLGHTGTQYANTAVHQSDLVVALGARLDLRQTGSKVDSFVPNGKVVRVDIDVAEIEHSRVRYDLAIVDDCKTVLAALGTRLKGVKRKDSAPWLAHCRSLKKTFALTFSTDGDRVSPQQIVEAVSRLAGDKKCIVVTGVGSHQQWVARHFVLDYPRRRWLTSGGHGAMGYDLPSAVGAKLACPGDEVLCLVGDGSLQINIQEFAAIVEHKLAIKVIVLDNRRLGIVSQFQNLNWDTDPSTGNKWNPPFSKIASAYGLASFEISKCSEIEPTLKRFMEATGPALVHCHIDPEADVIPMLLANQPMDNMWPYSETKK